MKLINPVGRNATDNLLVDSSVQPFACMCSTESAYVTAKGDDGCFHCGCSCSSTTYSAGNSSKAFRTIRKSGEIE